MKTDDILANAERLLDDARALYDGGRTRSAATLVVHALEQLGAFAQACTREKYPDVTVSSGLFGNKRSAHARRQDALVTQVCYLANGSASSFLVHWTFAEETAGSKFDWEQYEEWCRNHHRDDEKFSEWLGNGRRFKYSDAQMKVVNEHPWTKAANSLLDLAHKNQLEQLRDFGLYLNVQKFSDEAIGQVLELAAVVHDMLKRSRHAAMPAAPWTEVISRDEYDAEWRLIELGAPGSYPLR